MSQSIEKLWELANEFYLKSEYKEESLVRGQICQLLPEDSKARHNYALSLLFSGNYNEAEKQFILALRMDPSDSRSYNNYGLLKYYVYGDIDSLAENLTKSLLYTNSSDEFIRHIHNYLMILSLKSSQDNYEKITYLKKLFKKTKHRDYISNLVDAFALINNAKLAFISKDFKNMKILFIESSKILNKINLENYSKGTWNTYEELMYVHEILSIFNNNCVLNDFNALKNQLKSSIDKMNDTTFINRNITFKDGVSKGTYILNNIHTPLINFYESILLAIDYFADGKYIIKDLTNYINIIRKYSHINYHNIDQELIWSIIFLKKTINDCESFILKNRSLNASEVRYRYWTQFSTIMSKYNYNYDSLLLESENILGLLDFGPFDKTKFKIIENIISNKIVTNIKIINHLFEYHTNIKELFLEDIEAVSKLHTPCDSSDDFSLKIGALTEFFQVPIIQLRQIVNEYEYSWKSLTLIEQWMIQNEYEYKPEIFIFLKQLNHLRNSIFPYHPSNKKFVRIMKQLGFSFPLDYSFVWRELLETFNSYLEEIQDALSKIS